VYDAFAGLMAELRGRVLYGLKENIVSIIWFLAAKHTFILCLMHYLGNMFRLTIESSSGPYIKIQILIHSKFVDTDLYFYVRA